MFILRGKKMKKIIIVLIVALLVGCTIHDYTDRCIVTYLVEGEAVDHIEFMDNTGRMVYCVFPTPFTVSVPMMEDKTALISVFGDETKTVTLTLKYYTGETLVYSKTSTGALSIDMEALIPPL
jgi:hypothetical protein